MSQTPLPDIARRRFLRTGVHVTASGVASLAIVDAQAAEGGAGEGASSKPLFEPGQTILFQGDSITDAGRNRDDREANSFAALGGGYAWLAASQLLASQPQASYRIYNRGISGNKVPQLADRWQADCLDLKPDVVSVLIGVNDFWHGKQGDFEGTAATYERDYRALLRRTRDALPDARLIVCEPFLLMAGQATPELAAEFAPYRAAARRLAHESGARFAAFQTMFDRASKFAAPETWADDGIHPTAHGAALMAQWWLGLGPCALSPHS